MGEYASINGEQVKIGTCEEMYYLRADQARLVTPESGSVDPVRQAAALRFRFPWPNEDHLAPGAFDDYSRRLAIPGMAPPPELADKHYSIQFRAESQGYNVSLPCPEAGEHEHGLTVHRNGFPGAVFLCQQKLHEGALVPILECVCGLKWRVPLADAGPLVDAIEAAAQAERRREEMSYRHWNDGELPETWESHWTPIVARIRQGYDPAYVAELFPALALAG